MVLRYFVAVRLAYGSRVRRQRRRWLTMCATANVGLSGLVVAQHL
jgi:hypothetical protein